MDEDILKGWKAATTHSERWQQMKEKYWLVRQDHSEFISVPRLSITTAIFWPGRFLSSIILFPLQIRIDPISRGGLAEVPCLVLVLAGTPHGTHRHTGTTYCFKLYWYARIYCDTQGPIVFLISFVEPTAGPMLQEVYEI